MSTALFYQNLPSFSDFHGIIEERHFHPVPENWYVFITDVRGSTAAIEAGRYKDVNTIGAAAIVSVQNVVENLELPYVFGGDGATILVPPEVKEQVESALLGLKELSIDRFQLDLRVGCVPVSDLHREGARISVARYSLIGKRCVAIFRGGGIAVAESWVKEKGDRYQCTGESSSPPSLEGLSCRWQPVTSRSGKILSLLVVSRSEPNTDIYRTVLQKLDELFDGKIDSANPINLSLTSYKSVRQCIQEERRYHTSALSVGFLLRSFEIIAAVLIFKYKVPPLFFDPTQYSHSMRAHSDYRKFDDALRMVLDCTVEQIHHIREFLETLYTQGQIYYGIHESDMSLMTCYVNDLKEGNHIHFVDGGSGGYAMAAKQLKKQIRGS